MSLMIITSMCVMVECIHGTFGFKYKCENFTDHYIQEGQLVQVRRFKNSYSYVEIEACAGDNAKPVAFDPERVLKNGSIFFLVGIPWPFSHPTPTLQRVMMNDLTSFGIWGDCSKLQSLYVKQGSSFVNSNKLTMAPPNWLTNCTQLRSLDLRNVSTAEIRAVLNSAHHSDEVTLYHINNIANITHCPLFLKDRPPPRLKYVSLIDFSLNTDLRGTNITWAEISSSLIWQLSLLPVLEKLFIKDAKFDMCATTSVLPPASLGTLRSLSLQNTMTTRLCLKKYQAANVTDIMIWAPPLFNIQFNELLAAPAQQLLIDFRHFGQIVNFDFTREDYLLLSEPSVSRKGNLTVKGVKKSLECDCDGGAWWFSRAIKANLVRADGVTCTDDRLPVDLECESISCDRIKCNSPCVCCREGHDSVSADCREANLVDIPAELLRSTNITQIIAPNNHITSLPKHMPNTLLSIDLSGNNIWHAGAAGVDVLFTLPSRRVRLARNYILCSCENKLLIHKLQVNQRQIDDFANVTCAVTDFKLGDVDVSKLCESRDRDAALLKHRESMLAGVVATLIVSSACLTTAVVLYYRRRQIQMYMFARGWCLYCVTQEELDADRRFDIFISFCHEDTTLVLEELLPRLDRDYSVCLHLRDWCPGEMITTQITWSVEQSRRTMVIMSRNFVHSLWGGLEFQTAHVNGLAEGRTRVLMVVLDDVLEKEQLTAEMRAYVRLNTYVRWGDPWFWEKLKYALPHSPLLSTPAASQSNDSEPEQRYIQITEI